MIKNTSGIANCLPNISFSIQRIIGAKSGFLENICLAFSCSDNNGRSRL